MAEDMVLKMSLTLLCLTAVLSCKIPANVYLNVPKTILPGYEVMNVEFTGCAVESMKLTSNQSFTLKSNGRVEVESSVTVEEEGRTFSVWAPDSSSPETPMVVHLRYITFVLHKPSDTLRRAKRRWSPPPFHILENHAGPYPRNINEIVSDSAATHTVYYTFSGPGYDEPPLDVFSLDRKTGMLVVHQAVDRERYPMFTLITNVYDVYTNELTDKELPIQIFVDDVNDNAPEFKNGLQFNVLERSAAGSIVGKVEATDKDKDKDYVTIRYTLLTGGDLFAIHPNTGVITTLTNTLDRETKPQHMVTIQIKDLDGAANGLFNTGTATITLGDINDNPPTFLKTPYKATVNENEKGNLVLRIPVEDKDLVNTDNWITNFVIKKGNENGNFRVDRDPITNEGLLYVVQPLDYEKAKTVRVEIEARNKADLTGTTAQYLTVPVDLTVVDVDEGPEFSAPTVTFYVKENTPNGTVIGKYEALDPETKSSAGIKYYKVKDPASWINVERSTGELKVANTIDRESSFVQNGIYNITVKAVDASAKTGTGTVIIVVEDDNDNVPTVPESQKLLCEKGDEMGSVLVVAQDNDQHPFSSPFSFSFPPDNDGKWSLTTMNGTAARLQQMKALHTGEHSVPVLIRDLQGVGSVQIVKVRVCHCTNGVCPAKDSSSSLGPLGILALLLPLLLLLLLCLFFCCFCNTQRDKLQIDVGDNEGILLNSNTEAPGEEVDASLINMPIDLDQGLKGGSTKGSMILNQGWVQQSTSTMGGQSVHRDNINVGTINQQDFYHNQQYGGYVDSGMAMGSGGGLDSRYLTQNSSFLQIWQANGRYLQQKLGYMGAEEDGRYADDIVHNYGYEGAGSAAGSVGCCSDFGDNETMDFLNTLGPKFKTLGEVCKKT